jgi:hypothetical protein
LVDALTAAGGDGDNTQNGDVPFQAVPNTGLTPTSFITPIHRLARSLSA